MKCGTDQESIRVYYLLGNDIVLRHKENKMSSPYIGELILFMTDLITEKNLKMIDIVFY